jgi:hypothetical protein
MYELYDWSWHRLESIIKDASGFEDGLLHLCDITRIELVPFFKIKMHCFKVVAHHGKWQFHDENNINFPEISWVLEKQHAIEIQDLVFDLVSDCGADNPEILGPPRHTWW